MEDRPTGVIVARGATALAAGEVRLLLGVATAKRDKPNADSPGRSDTGTVTPAPDYELEKRVPEGVDVFDLNLRQTDGSLPLRT
jgi:hypothetical protein